MYVEKKRESILYVVIAYIVTYACWGLLIVLGIPAKQNALTFALYLLGALSTTIIALLIPLFAPKGERGAYYKRFFRFKVALKWYLIPFIATALINGSVYAVIVLFFKSTAESLHLQPFYMIVPLFFAMIVGGGLEEFGWRGILVHNLRKVNPILTSLAVGIIWACWHIPLFFIKGVTQYQNYFAPFFLSTIAFSFITTTIYLKSGSVIPCVVAHAGFNVFVDMGFWYCNTLIPGIVSAIIWVVFSAAFFLIFKGKHYLKILDG